MESDRPCFFEMPLGPGTCPLGVLAPWVAVGSGGGKRVHCQVAARVERGCQVQSLNGHKLFAEYLVFR